MYNLNTSDGIIIIDFGPFSVFKNAYQFANPNLIKSFSMAKCTIVKQSNYGEASKKNWIFFFFVYFLDFYFCFVWESEHFWWEKRRERVLWKNPDGKKYVRSQTTRLLPYYNIANSLDTRRSCVRERKCFKQATGLTGEYFSIVNIMPIYKM